MKSWDELKQEGSGHYKSGQVEPIDLYRAGGLLMSTFLVGDVNLSVP